MSKVKTGVFQMNKILVCSHDITCSIKCKLITLDITVCIECAWQIMPLSIHMNKIIFAIKQAKQTQRYKFPANKKYGHMN